jgi:hypothetical protein
MSNGLTGEAVFTFSGTDRVILAERLLMAAGMDVRVMPVPAAIRLGCGLCLRLPMSQSPNAERLLREGGIVPREIYERTVENGKSALSIMRKENDGR